jgi:uncharacterized protein (DUF2141 family)
MLLAAMLAFCAPASAAPGTASLEIHVRNVSPKGGIMRLGLYDAAGYPEDKAPVASADVPAVGGETVITLKNLAPGTYAIEAYQDVNSNDRMDTSWIGLPLEPYGFSRDASPILSKPGFDRVKFTLAPGRNTQVLHLQNSDRRGE